jgi:1-acyl-sn-glycerol-3-phosphate acyltransferase
MSQLCWAATQYLRAYHRWHIRGVLENPEKQVLFVANHGYGGVFDLNNLAVLATLDALAVDREVTALAHQALWTLGIGRMLEPLGARPASEDVAFRAFDDGHHVLVMPGGDVEAFKSYANRDRIVFSGRSGFARLAMEADVAVVPLVTAGAARTLLPLSDGQRLLRAVGIDKLLRLKAIPINVSAPWGLTVAGAGGLLPYVPLPATITTTVLPPMRPQIDDTPASFAARVESAMQEALSETT